jgi:two-component system response regulator HydG
MPMEQQLAESEPADAASLLLGNVPAIRVVRAQIRRISASGGGALIEGETGTGKELVARAIHASGPRARGAYVPVNCGAFAESLVQSELFGHRRGAFTGAIDSRSGFFEAAHRGTLFLDEISTLPRTLQPTLLRAVESGEIYRLGETTPRAVDLCLIAATNVALDEAVRAGTFRQDLLYRLNAFTIALPPLRTRPEDILMLAAHFLARQTSGGMTLGAAARQALLAYGWPGNVRELRNAMRYASTMADGDVVQIENLPPWVRGARDAPAPVAVVSIVPEARVEREAHPEKTRLIVALQRANGRIAQAATDLQMSRTKMWRRMRHHGIRPRW